MTTNYIYQNLKALFLKRSTYSQLLIVVFVSLVSTHTSASRFYVNATATAGTNTGTSWTNAYTSLQSAIAAAASGDSIWVAAGTYYPSAYPAGASSANTRQYSFYLAGGVSLFGGFAGTETSVAARVQGANTTLLSGDIGVANDNTDNCFHVLVSVNENIAGAIDGFTVTKGNANSNANINVKGSNINGQYGGGMHNRGSSPTITNCTFTENIASSRGSGMYNEASSSPTITQTTFSDNSGSSAYGGGIYNLDGSSAIISCSFIGNTVSRGGGVYNNNGSSTITNCLFSGNTATYQGGGIYNNLGTHTITSTTFSTNVGSNYGGGVYNQGGTVTLSNTIFWDNLRGTSATSAGCDMYGTATTTTTTYTILQSYSGGGTGCITSDPYFLDASNPAGADGIYRTADDGLRLYDNSLAVDAGDSSAIPSGITTDITGAARAQGTTVNMGAYEDDVPYTNIKYYVDSNAIAGGNTGASWANAYTSLQSALDVAKNRDSIWVAAGTYYPSAYPTGSSGGATSRDYAFYLDGGVHLYGGFAGTETILSARDYAANPTILSGDIGSTSRNDNCHHVLVSFNETIAGTLDGFTITKGYANGSGRLDLGSIRMNRNSTGGMFTYSSSQTIANCTFTDNRGNVYGGLYMAYSASMITNTIFSDNISLITYGYGGGAMYILYSSPTITECTFSGNQGTSGGAINIQGTSSSPVITRSTFIDNVARSNGNARGGGINISSATPTITNCSFIDNTASQAGGGVCNLSSGSIITGNTFSTNTSISTTNYGFWGGGGLFSEGNNNRLSNNIFWGNKLATSTTVTRSDMAGDDTATYSILQTYTGNHIGVGCVSSNPYFTDVANPAGADGIHRTADDGLRLLSVSPAIDAGNNDSIPSGDTTDIIGAVRVQGTTVNMGAYEDDSVYVGIKLYVDASATGANNGTSWANAYTRLQSAINRAVGSDSIWVAAGSYQPTHYPHAATGTSSKDRAFYLYGGIHIYGGFAGTETTLAARDFVNNVTTLQGNNYYHHLIVSVDESLASTLDGFTITQGNANATGSLVVKSRALQRVNGGGMYLYNSSPNIVNITFSDNTVTEGGGGIYLFGSSPIITNTIFDDNTADFGGGMYNKDNSNPVITNTIFIDNEARIVGNGRGGAVYNWSSSPVITNSNFITNSAWRSGAMHSHLASSSPIVSNCILWGQVTVSMIEPNITGAARVRYTTSKTINTAYYNNTNYTEPVFDDINNPAGPDGIFRTADDGLRLHTTSTAANTGNNDSIPSWITTDITGDLRIQGTTVTRGAYESLVDVRVHYVDSSAAGTNTGTSWTNAYTSLQSAIVEAVNGDTIWVAAGTYYPSALPTGGTITGSNSRDYAFSLQDGVRMYGGFAGTETTLAARDITANETILSGNNTCYHVVISVVDTNSGTLDGFTITRGNANGGGYYFIEHGGGQWGPGRSHGGGMDAVGNSTNIANCTFKNNRAATAGALIVKHFSTVSNCTFNNNISTSGSAGAMTLGGDATVTNCIFTENSVTTTRAHTGGGGIRVDSRSFPIIDRCTFIGNNSASGSQSGGGIKVFRTAAVISNCVFVSNSSRGGGIQDEGSMAKIVNCTFYGDHTNKPLLYGVGAVTNCIVWGGRVLGSTATWDLSYTSTQRNFTGTGNIKGNPQFVDTTNIAGPDGIHRTADDGLRLVSTSPALGAGNNDSIPSGITADIIGADRIQGTTVDMGAYEGIGGGVCLNAKVYLQGALLLSSTSTMTTDLNTAGVLPTTEPYTALSGFTHSGDGGGETTTTSILTSANIVDWVFIELRDKTRDTTVVETYAALLKSDGTIVSPVDGTSGVCFDNLADPEVYVSVRHRNHLGVMAASTVSLSSTGTTVDFSTATLYGTNAATTTNTVTALWAGDAYRNGNVKFQGSSNDAVIILNEVLGAAGNTFLGGSQGYTYTGQYSNSDMDMNGTVKYQGSSNDAVILLNNILNYPGNTFLGGSQGYSGMDEQLP